MCKLRFGGPLIYSALMISLAVSACWGEESSERVPSAAFGMELDYNSLYVWRGLAYSRGMVMQPSAILTVNDITVTSWSNCELIPEFGERHFNETDLTIAYSKEWRKISFEPSVQAFLYPRNIPTPNTAEAVLKIRYPLRSVGVFMRHSFDVIAYRGSYFGETGIDWQMKFGRRLELSASAGTGWGGARFNDAYLGLARSALNLVSLDIGLSWQVAKNLSLRPHANVSSLLDSSLRKSVSEPDLRGVGLTMHADF
jgi:hypothetical protein